MFKGSLTDCFLTEGDNLDLDVHKHMHLSDTMQNESKSRTVSDIQMKHYKTK